jgi:hypothetical protein
MRLLLIVVLLLAVFWAGYEATLYRERSRVLSRQLDSAQEELERGETRTSSEQQADRLRRDIEAQRGVVAELNRRLNQLDVGTSTAAVEERRRQIDAQQATIASLQARIDSDQAALRSGGETAQESARVRAQLLDTQAQIQGLTLEIQTLQQQLADRFALNLTMDQTDQAENRIREDQLKLADLKGTLARITASDASLQATQPAADPSALRYDLTQAQAELEKARETLTSLQNQSKGEESKLNELFSARDHLETQFRTERGKLDALTSRLSAIQKAPSR